MASKTDNRENECPTSEISAYIDGELSPVEEAALDHHLAECSECAADLNAQKQFLRSLDFSLEDTGEFKLPANFTKTVVASAESSVSGLRRRREARNAALICSGLFLIAIISVGADLPKVLAASSIFFEKIVAVISFVGHFVFDVALGITIVFRSLASRFVFGTAFGLGWFVAVLGFAVAVFSRLLHRDRQA